MSKLKPCPFCGAEVQDDERGEKYPRKSPMGGWIIHCECCGASLSQFRKSGKGEISWNTRPIEDDLIARIAELEEIDKLRSESISTLNQANANNEDEIELLEKRIAELEAMVKRLMRMVEDRFVLLGNSLDGHLQDCNCAVFLSSRMERDAWSELCYEWHGIYSDWQSANGHQAGKVSENEGSEG